MADYTYDPDLGLVPSDEIPLPPAAWPRSAPPPPLPASYMPPAAASVPPPPPAPPAAVRVPYELFPRGYRIPVGLGYATVLPDMDYETYSEAGYIWNEARQAYDGPPGAAANKKGLPVVGLGVYAEHPSTDVLCFAYDLKDGRGKRQWFPGMPNPQDLFDYLAQGGLIEAWNAGFEAQIWDKVCRRRYGWPALPAEQLRCAMAKGRAFALPGALGEAARVLQSAEQKDKEGDRLIKKFSMPRKPTKKDPRRRIQLAEDAVDGPAMARYNLQDIVTEAHASAMIPDLEGEELLNWLLDQRINRRGVGVDVPALENCIAIVEQALVKYNAELQQLTNGAVTAASELAKLQGWLGAYGVQMPAMDEEAIEAALARTDLPPHCRRALELREKVGSASVKKVFSMRNQATSYARLHDLFTYHGARTGRTTGNGPQPTNLPNSGPEVCQCGACKRHFAPGHAACPWCAIPQPPGKKAGEWNPVAVEDALAVIALRDLRTLEHYFGDAMRTVSGCLRGLFVAAPGHDLICSDYSAIEAVVLAMIAGEQWRIDVFRTHGKIYEASAAAISGVPFAEFMRHFGYTDAELEAPDWYTRKPATPGKHHPLRKTIGKVAELASGYQGWIGAWKAFGAEEFMNEDEMKAAILAWRAASPAIVEFWGGQERRGQFGKVPELYGVEGMFVAAVLEPGREFEYKGFKFLVQNDVLYLTLLSGRRMAYHRPRLGYSDRGGYSISYEGYNTNPKNGPVGWIRMSTWGGRITENIVQATARDIQWYGMRNLEGAGYPIVLHVYDENVGEVPEGFGSVPDFERIMSTMPPWAHDWPVKASGGWRGKRYRKD